MSQRPRLGELLVRAGVIDEDQLSAALARQERSPQPLGRTLIEMGLVDEETLMRTLARQLSVPVVWLRGRRVRADVVELVPRELIQKHRGLPVAIDETGEKTLLVAMVDPTDAAVVNVFALASGLPVRPVLAAPGELEDAIARHAEPSLDDLDDPEFVGASVPAEAPAPELLRMETDGEVPPAPDPAPARSRSNERVLRALTQLLVEKGVITREELIERLESLDP